MNSCLLIVLSLFASRFSKRAEARSSSMPCPGQYAKSSSAETSLSRLFASIQEKLSAALLSVESGSTDTCARGEVVEEEAGGIGPAPAIWTSERAAWVRCRILGLSVQLWPATCGP